MGEIIVEIDLVNVSDRDIAERGLIERSEVRRARIPAVADTGAISMVLPQDVVDHLGLPTIDHMTMQMADGSSVTLAIAGSLGVVIQGRTMDTDCIVVPAGAEALIGVVNMERMDLIPSPGTQTLSPRRGTATMPVLRI